MLRQFLNTVRTKFLKNNTFLITLWHRAGNVADGVSGLKNRQLDSLALSLKARQCGVRIRQLNVNDNDYTKISRYFTSSETGIIPCF